MGRVARRWRVRVQIRGGDHGALAALHPADGMFVGILDVGSLSSHDHPLTRLQAVDTSLEFDRAELDILLIDIVGNGDCFTLHVVDGAAEKANLGRLIGEARHHRQRLARLVQPDQFQPGRFAREVIPPPRHGLRRSHHADL